MCLKICSKPAKQIMIHGGRSTVQWHHKTFEPRVVQSVHLIKRLMERFIPPSLSESMTHFSADVSRFLETMHTSLLGLYFLERTNKSWLVYKKKGHV